MASISLDPIKTTLSPEDIRNIRLCLGLSQERFAQKVGCSFFSIHRYEKGLGAPSKVIQEKMVEIIKEIQKYREKQGI